MVQGDVRMLDLFEKTLDELALSVSEHGAIGDKVVYLSLRKTKNFAEAILSVIEGYVGIEIRTFEDLQDYCKAIYDNIGKLQQWVEDEPDMIMITIRYDVVSVYTFDRFFEWLMSEVRAHRDKYPRIGGLLFR